MVLSNSPRVVVESMGLSLHEKKLGKFRRVYASAIKEKLLFVVMVLGRGKDIRLVPQRQSLLSQEFFVSTPMIFGVIEVGNNDPLFTLKTIRL